MAKETGPRKHPSSSFARDNMAEKRFKAQKESAMKAQVKRKVLKERRKLRFTLKKQQTSNLQYPTFGIVGIEEVPRRWACAKPRTLEPTNANVRFVLRCVCMPEYVETLSKETLFRLNYHYTNGRLYKFHSAKKEGNDYVYYGQEEITDFKVVKEWPFEPDGSTMSSDSSNSELAPARKDNAEYEIKRLIGPPWKDANGKICFLFKWRNIRVNLSMIRLNKMYTAEFIRYVEANLNRKERYSPGFYRKILKYYDKAKRSESIDKNPAFSKEIIKRFRALKATVQNFNKEVKIDTVKVNQSPVEKNQKTMTGKKHENGGKTDYSSESKNKTTIQQLVNGSGEKKLQEVVVNDIGHSYTNGTAASATISNQLADLRTKSQIYSMPHSSVSTSGTLSFPSGPIGGFTKAYNHSFDWFQSYLHHQAEHHIYNSGQCCTLTPTSLMSSNNAAAEARISNSDSHCKVIHPRACYASACYSDNHNNQMAYWSDAYSRQPVMPGQFYSQFNVPLVSSAHPMNLFDAYSHHTAHLNSIANITIDGDVSAFKPPSSRSVTNYIPPNNAVFNAPYFGYQSNYGNFF